MARVLVLAVLTMSSLLATPATAAAPAVSPAAYCQGSSEVLAYGNWECGKPEEHSPWEKLYSVKAEHSFQRRADTEPRQGAYAARFEVRPGDSPGYGERSEVGRANGFQARPGDELYYAFSIRHEPGWSRCLNFCLVGQWLQQGPTGTPPLALAAPEGAGERQHGVHLKHRAGVCTPAPPGGHPNDCAVDETYELLSSEEFDQTLGRWHDWVIRVRWSAGDDGLIEVWHRTEGDDDVGHWEEADVPTLKSIKGSAGPVVSRVGLYRSPHDKTHVVHHDGYCVATSLSAAWSCLTDQPDGQR